MTTSDQSDRGEVLVAIMNNQPDFRFLEEQHWYRVPVDTAPKRWPPQWLAFYQTKVFGDEAYAVRYYGRVRDIRIVRRAELFPNEPPNPKSGRRYYQVHLRRLEQRDKPILSRRRRRIVFISTTWTKFARAVEINDLHDESPLEDRLWAQFKHLQIAAERQWHLKIGRARYCLDFALFCKDGKINIETDGITYHIDPDRWARDRRRDTRVETAGWRVLRFTGQEIREEMADYCIPEITKMANRLGGPKDEGLVPRTFHETPEGLAQQLTLFEEDVPYDVD